jgi:hypothetical protein
MDEDILPVTIPNPSKQCIKRVFTTLVVINTFKKNNLIQEFFILKY